MASKMRFYLDISKEEYLRSYSGSAHSVFVQAEDGRTLRFPAVNLRQFVTSEGVHGRFEISLDENNSLLEIRRLN
jgi:hypothetical protein